MTSSERIAYVGIGSNLDNPRDQVLRALEALARLPGTRCVARSALYETAPVGLLHQPAFINAVAALRTTQTADDLLCHLRDIEAAHGRSRSVPNGPRTLDLDLLIYDEQIMTAPALTLPHPRMHHRAFVLVPLIEIAPTIVIPGLGPASAFLPGLLDQGITRLNP